MINAADIRLDSWFFRLFKYWLSGFVGIKSDYKNSSLVLFISEIYFNLQVETDDSCRSEEQQNQRCVTNQSYQWSLTSEGVAVVINQNVCVCSTSINRGGKHWIWIWMNITADWPEISLKQRHVSCVCCKVLGWKPSIFNIILSLFLYINDVIFVC